MAVRRVPKSSHYHYDFTIKGNRFRGSTNTDKKPIAEAIEAKLRSDALLGNLTNRKPEMTLDAACGRYLMDHAAQLPDKPNITWHIGEILPALGKQTALHNITDSNVAHAVARWRATLVGGSINRRLTVLRSIMNMAQKAWGAEVAMPHWKAHWQREAAEREHVLSAAEERALFTALRPDFHGLVRFALISGMRLANCIHLTWRQVDWDAKLIKVRVKSKKPGGEVHVLPITPALAAILSLERDRHEVRVFTYVCARNRHDPKRKMMQRKGERSPFTKHGWRRAWMAALRAADIEDFRFHDLRHTAGTRALHAHKNLKTVQRMLGHKDIKTTLRYTRSDVADVRAAMEAVEAQSGHTAAVTTPESKEKTGS